MKTVNIVNTKYLYKKCKKCEDIKHIDDYSTTQKIDNLIYTQGKCKQCRASLQNLKYRQKKDTNDKKCIEK